MTIQFLSNLVWDLQHLNPNIANLIKDSKPETQMKIHLIYVLIQLRSEIRTHNPLLSQQYNALREDYIQYLKNKIARNDLTNDFADLLFEIDSIAKHKLNMGVGIIIPDIRESSHLNPSIKADLIRLLEEGSFDEVQKSIRHLKTNEEST